MAVLVAYASKHGATEGIAQRIAAQLRQLGQSVDLQPVESAGDPARYEACVIGSAVYMGSWMKEAADFVRSNREALAGRPVWLFSSGPTGTEVLAEPKEIAEFQAAIQPREHHEFAGVLDRHELSFPERMIVKAVKAPEGDFRDWAEIDAWAERISVALASAPHAV